MQGLDHKWHYITHITFLFTVGRSGNAILDYIALYAASESRDFRLPEIYRSVVVGFLFDTDLFSDGNFANYADGLLDYNFIVPNLHYVHCGLCSQRAIVSKENWRSSLKFMRYSISYP